MMIVMSFEVGQGLRLSPPGQGEIVVTVLRIVNGRVELQLDASNQVRVLQGEVLATFETEQELDRLRDLS